MKIVNKLRLHPNYAMRKSIFLSICVFFVSMLSFLTLSVPQKSLSAENEFISYFTVVTDNEYGNTSCGEIALNGNTLYDVPLKDYLKYAKSSRDVVYTATASASVGYVFLGWYFAESEYYAYEQNCYLVSMDDEIIVNVNEESTGYYMAYFASTAVVDNVEFYNNFEAEVIYPEGYDSSLISEHNAYSLNQPLDSRGNAFSLSIEVSQYMDIKLELERHGFIFETYDSTDFLKTENEGIHTYSKSIVNQPAYNNFCAEDVVTYRFIITPKLLSKTIRWRDQRYYNVNNGLIEERSTFTGYYGESVYDTIRLEYLSNSDRLTLPSPATIFDSTTELDAEFNLSAYLVNIMTESGRFITSTMIVENNMVLETNRISGPNQADQINATIFAYYGLGVGTDCLITYRYLVNADTGLRTDVDGNVQLTNLCYVGKNINLYITLTLRNWEESTPVVESENTYSISSADELVWFMTQVNNGNTFEGKTIVLASDIDLDGKNWTPIGVASFSGIFDDTLSSDYNGALKYIKPSLFQTSNSINILGEESSEQVDYKPFKGAFNGNGFTISNVNLFSNKIYIGLDLEMDGVGFFGCVENATIINLKLASVNISGSSLAGGLCAVAINSKIVNNQIAEGSIAFPVNFNRKTTVSLGGAIGVAFNCEISKVYSKMDINNEHIKDSEIIASYIGGVVGESLMSNISESVHRGELHVEYNNIKNKAYSYVAGISAVNANGQIENCLAITSIISEGNNNFAGITGTASMVLNNLAYITEPVLFHSPVTLDLSAVGVVFGGVANNLVNVCDTFVLTHGGISSQYNILGESKSDEQLKTASTYSNWDTSVWNIENGIIPSIKSISTFSVVDIPHQTKTYWEDQTVNPIVPIGDVYTVENVENLVWVMQQVNSGANSFENKTIILDAPNSRLDLSGHEWTPIGVNVFEKSTKVVGDNSLNIAIMKNEIGFKGVFDGNNHTIYGLTQTSCVNNLAGLFGNITEASIKNLILEDVNINCRDSKYTFEFDEMSNPNYCVGALAAKAYASEIITCQIIGDSILEACGVASSNYEKIIGISSREVSPAMVLQMRFSQLQQNATFVGGAVGLSEQSTFLDIQNYATINGVVVGGVIGYVQGALTFNNALNNGLIKGVIAGGILGAEGSEMPFEKMWSFGISTNSIIVGSSYYNKNVELLFSKNTGSVKGSALAGGIIGGGQAKIKNSFNSGEITGVIGLNGVSYSEGIASFGSIAGGIAGSADSIYDCYNIGLITTYSVPNIAYTSFKGLAGGIAGRANNIVTCYNNAIVQCQVSRESLSFSKSRATEMASGIVAFAQNTLIIKNVFNIGTILGSEGHKAEIIGAISKLEPFLLTKNINIDQSDLDLSYAYSYGSNDVYCYIDESITILKYEAKNYSNRESLKNIEFFEDLSNWENIEPWNFVSIWMFDEDNDEYDYPVLQNMNYSIVITIVEDSDLDSITTVGDGLYHQGQTIKLIATHPDGYYAKWRAPNGGVYFGDILDFRFNLVLFGEYELLILPNETEAVEVLAVLSNSVGDSLTLYGDEYGIRANVALRRLENGDFVMAGINNVLPHEIVRNRRYIAGWNTSEDGTGTEVFANTDFINLGTNTIYAVWASDYYDIEARVINGNVENAVDHDGPYMPSESFSFDTSNKHGYTFQGWRINGTFVDSTNEEYGINFVGQTLSVVVSDLANWLDLNSSETIIIEAVYTNEVVSVDISSNNVLLGTASFDEDYGTFTYGQVVSMSATEIEGARFQYWQDELTGTKYYTQSGLILIATRDLSIKAYFVLNGHSVYVNANSNVEFNNVTMGLNVVENGEDFAFSFSVPSGYYLEAIYIDDVAQELSNNILIENVTSDHEIVIVIKLNSDVSFTLDSPISGLVAYFSVTIGEKSYNFTLEHGQTKRFSGIEQMQTLVYNVSVPTRYTFNVELDGAMLIENSISTSISQTISVFAVKWTNDYLTDAIV